jgi:hypothetical protein
MDCVNVARNVREEGESFFLASSQKGSELGQRAEEMFHVWAAIHDKLAPPTRLLAHSPVAYFHGKKSATQMLLINDLLLVPIADQYAGAGEFYSDFTDISLPSRKKVSQCDKNNNK